MISPPPIQPTPRAGVLPITPEKEYNQRQAVLAEAKKWIGTPYHQMADVLSGGIDCNMLLVRAWVDAGIFEPFDPRPYPSNWHMHQSEERYLAWMEMLALEIDTQPQVCDIRLMTFGKCFSHGGIYETPTRMIHAHQSTGFCCASDTKEAWVQNFGRGHSLRKRPTKNFDIWAKLKALPV